MDDNLTEHNKTKIEQAKQMFDNSENTNIEYHRNTNFTEISKTAVVAATILLGVFGVHDFMLGKKSEGLRHLLLISIMPLVSFVTILLGNTSTEFSSIFNGPIMVISLPLIAVLVSWIWGLVELSGYLQENSDSNKIIIEEQRSELDADNIKTTLSIAAVASIAALIIEIVTICLYIPHECAGSSCIVGWILPLMMCFISLEPFLVSIVFTSYWLRLRSRLKRSGQLSPKLRKYFIVSLGLLCGMLAGFIAVTVGIVSS